MKRNIITFLTLGFLIFSFNSLLPGKSSEPTTGLKILNEVLDSALQLAQESSIYFKQVSGLKIEKLPDFSYKMAESQNERLKSLLEKLQKIKLSDLSYEETITLRKIEWEMKNMVEGFRFFWLNFPIASYSSPIPDLNRFFTDYRFEKEEDPGQYLALAAQYPTAIEQISSILQEQYRKQIVFPQEGLKPIIDYYTTLIQPVDKSFLYVSSERLKKDGVFKNSKEADEFDKKLVQIISTRVNPALEKLLFFIKGDYYKAAPVNVGLWQYPGGIDYYKYLVKTKTELDITPEDVHRIGREQIEILKKELDLVRQEVKFEGDLDSFIRYLKTDPQFRLNSAEEMGEKMMKFKAQVEKQLPRFFIKIPDAPCDVKRLEPALESSITYGFYRPPLPSDNKGYYYYNGSNLGEKNRISIACAALITHELIPGHHFHFARQSEIKNVHPLIKEMFNNAFAEGWAQYASALGEEMEVYKDPYEQCGRIMGDLFVTMRLVVDTGMNYFRWPRQKAKDLMKKYLFITDREIESETLRYSIGIPAQALGYKIGLMKFLELRRKTELALGSKFDIREFHEALLENGSMPLFLLENHIRHFIDSKLSSPLKE